MATEDRLIGANALMEHLEKCIATNKGLFKSVCVAIKCFVEQMPTVDAVEVSRLGELGRLMMPYSGCPRGRMGHRGCAGSDETTVTVMELDAIEDIDGNLWIPVLADDLKELEKITQDRDRWKSAALYYMEKCSKLSEEAER